MRKLLTLLLACVCIGAGAFWVLTRPAPIAGDFAAGHSADVENGALVFAAAGCASCHAAPGAKGDAKLILAGGMSFVSDFGTFYAPNISSDATHGIGGWTLPTFARAVTEGVSPQGQHYYPAFPYTSYGQMTDTDVADLFVYMQGLPASEQMSEPHGLGFPFTIRRGLGLWKMLNIREGYVAQAPTPELERGRYLVEVLAHCDECHTPRGALGGLDRTAWMTGAPNPSGQGRIPGLTPAQLDWSAGDLVEYFTSGFTPDYDSVGGSMVAVVDNLAQLPVADREAIAAYIKALP